MWFVSDLRIISFNPWTLFMFCLTNVVEIPAKPMTKHAVGTTHSNVAEAAVSMKIDATK